MPWWNDLARLLADQYRDSANLDARVQLHARFSTNRLGWHRWVFEQFHLQPGSKVLELGSGPAYLWQQNLERVPSSWRITLSDFSWGMLQEARQSLRASADRFQYVLIDAQAIPLPAESLDVVIANHMLYHVPDRTKALAGIRRVLKQGGRLYATTVGREHMQELDELVCRFDPSADARERHSPNPFVLENGLEQIGWWFEDVALHRYEDALVVTEAQPLVAYVQSSPVWGPVVGDRRGEFSSFVQRELDVRGAIDITKDSGIFMARK
jgi:SAM-dependent methyltransferase